MKPNIILSCLDLNRNNSLHRHINRNLWLDTTCLGLLKFSKFFSFQSLFSTSEINQFQQLEGSENEALDSCLFQYSKIIFNCEISGNSLQNFVLRVIWLSKLC